MNIFRRIKRAFHREPDFIVGGKDAPYLRRWWVIPRNRFFNIYLHNIIRDDDDHALHDHPWHWCSIHLRGAYYEILEMRELEDYVFDDTDEAVLLFQPRKGDTHTYTYRKDHNGDCYDIHVYRKRRYRAGSIRFRRAERLHRLEIDRRAGSCWTLFLTGPVFRTWGFSCPKGWVPWHEFVAEDDKGAVGRGCGEQ